MEASSSFILISSVAVFAILFIYLRREYLDSGGKAAAKSTRGLLSRFALLRGFKVLSDVELKNGEKAATIENMLIGYFGILLVRTLGSRGEYYGTLDSENWTLAAKGTKYSIENPAMLLEAEESALRTIFSKNKIYNVPIEKIIYISNKSDKTAVYITHGGEILLGGKLSGYLEKSKFEKDAGIDVNKIVDIVNTVHSV